jgi:DNA-binding NtrC family response regulator
LADDKLSRRLSKIVTSLVRRDLPLEPARREFERQFILASLRKYGGNVGKSAQALGIHRNTLRNKISSLGIDIDCVRQETS